MYCWQKKSILLYSHPLETNILIWSKLMLLIQHINSKAKRHTDHIARHSLACSPDQRVHIYGYCIWEKTMHLPMDGNHSWAYSCSGTSLQKLWIAKVSNLDRLALKSLSFHAQVSSNNIKVIKIIWTKWNYQRGNNSNSQDMQLQI